MPSSSSSSSSSDSASGSETESRESENRWKDVRISLSFWARDGARDVVAARREEVRVGADGVGAVDVLARVRFVVVVVEGALARLRFGGWTMAR